jgi:hypothetical protein
MPTAASILPPRLQAWLHRSERTPAFWLGKRCVLVAWLGLAVAVLCPPQGAGLALCWVEGATGVPCPGCGMTRSLSCAARGMFTESWSHHPFGLFVLGLFLFTAIQSLLPQTARNRIVRFLQTHAPCFNGFYFSFVIAFVGFGAGRAVLHFSQNF